jgi:uncharacterized membrane protein (DUF106 family)
MKNNKLGCLNIQNEGQTNTSISQGRMKMMMSILGMYKNECGSILCHIHFILFFIWLQHFFEKVYILVDI